MYNQVVFQDICRDQDFRFIKGDVRNQKQLREAATDCDAVIHLAGIVGAPACHKDPETSQAVNVEGVRNALKIAADHEIPFIFPSTGSAYGHIASGMCSEETPISPLTAYGRQKAESEQYVQSMSQEWMIFRFATAFGASPRPRLDLLLNDFTYQAKTRKSLVVYEAGFWRTFIHVYDMARVFLWAVTCEAKTIEDAARYNTPPRPLSDENRNNRIYNVGHPDLNLTKAEVARAITSRVPGCLLNLAGEGSDPDARNYAVDYSRITKAGFSCIVGLKEGLDELFQAYDIVKVPVVHSNHG